MNSTSAFTLYFATGDPLRSDTPSPCLSPITRSAYRRGCRVMFGCLLCVVNVECHHQKRCSLNVFIDRRCTPSNSMAGGASSLKEKGCPDSDMVINFQHKTMQNELLKRVTFFWHLRKGAMKWFQVPIIKRG